MNTANLFSAMKPCGRRHASLSRKTPSILVAILLLVSVGVGAAQTSPPVQTSPPPDTTSVSLGSPLREVLNVAPGGNRQGEIVLVNGSDQAVTVQVSQVDFLPGETGVEYPEPGSLPRSNAAWLEVTPGDVRIPAGQQLTVPYSVRVPNDPSLAGSYWSMIMLTPSDAADVQQTQEGEVRTSVRTQFRYGVSVVTTLGDSGESQLSFENPQFERAQGEAETHLQVSLQNGGERLLSPALRLELYDQAGAQVNSFEAQAERIFPGASVRQAFDLGALTPGEYTAVVIADAGGEDVFGTRYSLNVGETP